jgi:hypothetical protein
MPTTSRLPFAATMALLALLSLPGVASAARFVEVTVSLDGKIVLTGSRGDDGSADVDDVWNYLKTLKLVPTEHFAGLKIPADAQSALLKSSAPVGQPGEIVVSIDYGGIATTRELRLVREPPDKYGREWRIHAEDLDDLFDERLITRRQAADLHTPQLEDRRRAR